MKGADELENRVRPTDRPTNPVHAPTSWYMAPAPILNSAQATPGRALGLKLRYSGSDCGTARRYGCQDCGATRGPCHCTGGWQMQYLIAQVCQKMVRIRI